MAHWRRRSYGNGYAGYPLPLTYYVGAIIRRSCFCVPSAAKMLQSKLRYRAGDNDTGPFVLVPCR